MLAVLYLVCLLVLASTATTEVVFRRQETPPPQHLESRVQDLGWVDPSIHGGQMLDFTLPGLGEPINVIISGLSDPRVLSEDGLHAYGKSLGFSQECLGVHIGNVHEADLGDGNGRHPEQYLARQRYFPIWGTCWETLIGGEHFRAWKQNGTLANTQAWFLASSKEKDLADHHMIADNGYDLGRDYIVQHAVAGSKWKGVRYHAEVEWVYGLLESGSKGVNHNITQDGRVAVLTVRLV